MINLTPLERRKHLWAHVYRSLLPNAIPDSRYNLDFLSFTPDFRYSSLATERLVALPAYTLARTLLITSDNSCEALRLRALRDGKKVLVGTYRLRRGFVILDPCTMADERFEVAACLDGMEKHGLGRRVTLAQLRDEHISIDLCVTGGLVFNQQGVSVWEGQSLFEVQWAVLLDMGCVKQTCPVVAIAHACQVVDEGALGIEKIKADRQGEVQCDMVIVPEKVFEVREPVKAGQGIDFEAVDREALDNIPVLQELKGIRMVERIMRKGKGKEKEKEKKRENGVDENERGKEQEEVPPIETPDEAQGIEIVKRLLKGYKV